MSDIVISLEKATKLYSGVPAIEEVDFELARGEIHALVGENGAGKSTLTKVMAGVVTLTSGTMKIDGARSRAEHAAGSAPSRRRHGVPGEQPGADHDGGAKPVPRSGALLQPPARHQYRGAAVPAVAQLRRSAHGHGRRAGRGQEADGRDRARGAAQREGDRLRRADRGLDARRKEILLRSRARPQEARRFHRLHQPCAGRGADPRRPHYRAARRQKDRDRRRPTNSTARASCRRWSAATSRTRSTASRGRRCARRASASSPSRTSRWRRW